MVTNDPLLLTPVAPIGERRAIAYFCGNLHEHTEKVYPPSPEGVRLAGVRMGTIEPYTEATYHFIHLRDAARLLGISPSSLSDLENGRATCDWSEAEHRLRRTVTP